MFWFTADQHFWHSRIIKHANRPFDSVEEMNKTLIDNWNDCVKPTDTVYVLGDMFWCGRKKAEPIVKSLLGKKILVKGNHDSGTKRWLDMGFKDVCEREFFIYDNNHWFNLSHYPYYPNLFTRTEVWFKESIKEIMGIRVAHAMKRTLDKRLKDDGNWLLHGHVHNSWKTNKRQINVGVDVWGYKPVSIDAILSMVNKC